MTKTAIYLADKYDDYYDDQTPRLSMELVVAGAMLHDIGQAPRDWTHTRRRGVHQFGPFDRPHLPRPRYHPRKRLRKRSINAETLLRLEHIILSHQRLPEWGSPKPR